MRCRTVPTEASQMPNILFTWELGAGNGGHQCTWRRWRGGYGEAGHNVFVALRDPAEAETAFAGSDVHYVAAPHYNGAGRAPAFPVTHNFAHVLGNCGWSDDHKLFALMCCWANLYAR